MFTNLQLKNHNILTKIQENYWVNQKQNRFHFFSIWCVRKPSEKPSTHVCIPKLEYSSSLVFTREHLPSHHTWFKWIWNHVCKHDNCLDLSWKNCICTFGPQISTILFWILWARSGAIFLRTWMKNMPKWIPQSWWQRLL
jgi:hypothetical protein